VSKLLQLESVGVRLPIGGDLRPVITDLSLSISDGESLGLVGESGSGKSMTARTIGRLLPPGAQVTGAVRFDGADVHAMDAKALRRIRTNGVAFIFQDPRAHLDPLQRIGDFMIEPAVARGTTGRAAALASAAELLRQVGIDDPARRLGMRPHELSGGMLQRVMIAAVLLAEPRLILADEPTTALDVMTQSEVLAVLDELRRSRGTALLFITHDLDLAVAVCDRIAVMYAGTLQELRPAAALHDDPRHPYTSALLASRPELAVRQTRLPVIPGRPVSAFEAPGGCVFSSRCPHATPTCRVREPGLVEVADGVVRCSELDRLARV
jgi:oligopeptide/dipeptide ABC transporter ATP-binding protein